MAFTKINAAGIGTTETVTVDGLTVINDGSFGGNLTVSGVLTYEDVTNVDSVGLITARNGVVVGSGITLSKDGDIFATGITTVSGNVKVGTGITLSPDGDGFYTGVVTATTFSGALAASNLTGALPAISGANLTNLDASDLASGTVPTARLGSGTASSSTFLRGDSTFAAVTSTTINNNADNRLITGSDTANTLNGEANLTMGNDLQFTTTANGHAVKLVSTGAYYNKLSMDSGVTSAGAFLNIIDFSWDGDKVSDIVSVSGSDTTNKDDGHLIFRTSASQGSITERLRITSGGNIGIGDRTTSPDELLHVHTASGEAIIHVEAATNPRLRLRAHSGESIIQFADAASSNPGEINYTHSSDTMSFRTNGSVQAAINSNGQLLVGTTTAPAYNNRQMTVGDASDSVSFIEIRTSTSGVGHLLFSKTHEANSGNYNAYIAYAHNTNLMTFHNNGGNERMRISEHGDLTLNSSATDTRLGIKARSNATGLEFVTCRDTSDTLKFYIASSGATYNAANTYGSISDQSVKENIVDANSQWDDIKNIKVRNFNFTAASGMDTHTQIGCVAQEVETVSPKLISEKDGVKSVSYSVLYMKAVKALQEAQTRIETLESKVAALEG